MSKSNLIELKYFNPNNSIQLTAYAETIITEKGKDGSTITAIRFGGYPEVVQAMSDALYGGATVDATQNDANTLHLRSVPKSYRRQISHDGIYAVATLMMTDDVQTDDKQEQDTENPESPDEQQAIQPRRCYIFCPDGDRERLFEELDRKTAAPLIPAFRDYVLDTLVSCGDLHQLSVFSLKEKLDAWVLHLLPVLPDDANVVQILEQGLKTGAISIPNADATQPDGFQNVNNITEYLNTFGVTVADRIRNQFHPLFDPAAEPLSSEILAKNDCIQQKAGYSLYDAQLAVAEAVKQQLARKGIALIVAECGSGKTKIGASALGALHGLMAAQWNSGVNKTFNIVLAPSHVTQKWVREISETLPDTYGVVVRTITALNRLYAMYEEGDKTVFAVFSKERARDGYMRYPAVTWNRRQRAFLCPDCMKPVEMLVSEDGTKYWYNADQFYFQAENRANHT